MQLIENIVDTQRTKFDTIGSFNVLDDVEINLTITGNSTTWHNPTFELHGLKADNTKVRQITGISIVDKINKIIKIHLLDQMVTCSGTLQLQLIIKDNDRTSSTIFCAKVNKSLEFDKTTSTDSIKIYADLEELNKTLIINEAVRNENEGVRETAEELRQLAETEREEKFNQIETHWNNIKDDEVISEVQNSRTSMFEGEKDSLGERLNTDLSEINRKFDEGQYIEYNDHNITANNSLAGYTKDMRIEGTTYQNLCINGGIEVNYDFSINNSNRTSIFNVSSAAGDGVKTIIVDVTKNSGVELKLQLQYKDLDSEIIVLGRSSGQVVVKNTKVDKVIERFLIYLSAPDFVDGVSVSFKNVMILNSDYTNLLIPSYFEKIKSVGEAEENKISILSRNEILFDTGNQEFTAPSGGNQEYVGVDVLSVMKKNLGKYITLSADVKIRDEYADGSIQMYILGEYRIKSGISRVSASIDKNNWVRLNINGIVEKSENDINKGSTLSFYGEYGSNVAPMVTKINIYEGDKPLPYTEEKIDKKDILLPNTLKGLKDGVKDTIEFINNKWCYVQRVSKVILNGSEDWFNWGDPGTTDRLVKSFAIILNQAPSLHDFYCLSDKFKSGSSEYDKGNHVYYTKDKELIYGYYVNSSTNKVLGVSILKSKLSTEDVEGFKAWLQDNPITVYYELETSIITQLDLNPNLISWEGTTHIFSENSISPRISCKISTNIPALLSDLQTENQSLKNDLNENNEKIIDASLYSVENDYRLTLLELGLV